MTDAVLRLRVQAENDLGNVHRNRYLMRDSTVYGAVAGLELSTDSEDVQKLLNKCRRHGLSLWLPSGCWQEGTKHAATAS